MKQVNKKNVPVLIIAGVLLLTAIGATLAAYYNQKEFNNKFSVAAPGVAIKEQFNPTDKWVPGEQKEKKVWFTNTGQQTMLLRFSLDVKDPVQDTDSSLTPDQIARVFQLYWADSKGAPLENALAPSDFVALSDSDGKTYYYYEKLLKANENVPILHSVKLNPALSNDGHTGSDYSDIIVELTINGEMVLANEEAAKANWLDGTGIQIAIDESKGTVSWSRQ